VDILLDAYEKVKRTVEVLPLRFSIINGNFFTTEALYRFKAPGIIADYQPAWFYKDGDAMLHILGGDCYHAGRSYQPGGGPSLLYNQ